MVAAIINVMSMLVYLWFGSAEDQFGAGVTAARSRASC